MNKLIYDLREIQRINRTIEIEIQESGKHMNEKRDDNKRIIRLEKLMFLFDNEYK